ncbi:hypothetical protein C4D60_Mb05t25740 [Musa balbisiana]|uniref:Uncharacterized protein n=1 Tax=Musa balbisiana TaxID=52838 RepID=A0A4S8JYV2_MUSBA|nr:hypothetical protein C4D60_Mb05t25740 [Musa balbisiana]
MEIIEAFFIVWFSGGGDLTSEMEAHDTNHFCNAKSKSNGGVGKGHDSCKNREPCHVMEIWNLGEHYLNNPKHHHVEAISIRARSSASLSMGGATCSSPRGGRRRRR